MKTSSRLILALFTVATLNIFPAHADQKSDEQDARRNQIRADRAAYEAERLKSGTARPWDRDANGFRPMDVKPAMPVVR